MGFNTVGSYALLHLTAGSPTARSTSRRRSSAEWVPVTADPADVEQHGRDLWAAINDAGGIAAYTPPPTIPESVSAWQFKLQLLAAELPDQVATWIASQSQAVQIAYANSGTFLRTEPVMQQGFAAPWFHGTAGG
jgi:hypothetical protein